MKREMARNGQKPVCPKKDFQKEMSPMNEQQIRMLALQASGEYMMKHIAGIMGVVEDKRSRNKEGVLNEETLVTIEAQVKAIAEELIQRSKEYLKGV
jgi:hypothetical protein